MRFRHTLVFEASVLYSTPPELEVASDEWNFRLNLKMCSNCKFCDFVGSNSDECRNHIKSLHPELYQLSLWEFKCEYCNRTFQLENSLLAHKHKEHLQPIILKYECDLCSQKFQYKNALLNHTNIEHLQPEINFDIEERNKEEENLLQEENSLEFDEIDIEETNLEEFVQKNDGTAIIAEIGTVGQNI